MPYVFKKAAISRTSTLTLVFSAKSVNSPYFIDSCIYIAHCSRLSRRRGTVICHVTRLAAATKSLEVAVKAVERHCRLHFASYTERSSNPSAFVAVWARSFYLGSSWSSTKSTRVTRLNAPTVRAMNSIGNQRCFDINHT